MGEGALNFEENMATLSISRMPSRKASHSRRLVGRSPQMRYLCELMERAANSCCPVLITGESGTGKELVARGIHEMSPRRSGSFIAVNCASLPESLMESELFGHERGAFTGAECRRVGCFELANGGTLLLDEIGETKPGFQAKLLRVIEERKFRRLGGTSEVSVDARILASTNRDLAKAVLAGTFRLDLYYRLNVLEIETPPLRKRSVDIPDLVDHFLHQIEQPEGQEIVGIDVHCMEMLKAYSWPGNVRQLHNAIERAFIVARSRMISAEDLPHEIRRHSHERGEHGDFQSFEVRLGTSLEAAEAELIQRTLKFVGGDKSRAAEILGVSLKTLYNRLDRSRADWPDRRKANTERRG